MLSKKMEKALNEQLNAELASAYLYLAMAAAFKGRSLDGFAHWMRKQAEEERGHAMRFYDYIQDRNGTVKLMALAAPPSDWKSPLAMFQDTYQHEQEVTVLIHNLVNLAEAEKDHPTRAFLQWFVTEQVEEEAQAFDMVQKLNLTGGSAGGILVLDHHAGKRGE